MAGGWEVIQGAECVSCGNEARLEWQVGKGVRVRHVQPESGIDAVLMWGVSFSWGEFVACFWKAACCGCPEVG